MKTNPNSIPARMYFPTLCAARLLPLVGLLLLLALPAGLQAQFSYTTNNGAIAITGYTGPGGDVTIPDSITGLPVTSIGYDAFFNCTKLTSVTIPNNVTNIGEWAFEDCTSLTNVTIPNSVSNIGAWAFENCNSLTSVTIPDSVASIEYGAFYGCTSLTSVTIPNSVTRISGDWGWGRGAFAECSGLTNVTIGNSVTNIGSGAFYGCYSLTEIYFQGNAPGDDQLPFRDSTATVYYLPGTTGWGATFSGLPTVLWTPRVQTGGANFGVRTNHFGFDIAGTTNLVVVVEACTNLAHPVWSPVRTNTLTGGSSYFSDADWTNHPIRFYRLRSP